jgi:hypothetical protein
MGQRLAQVVGEISLLIASASQYSMGMIISAGKVLHKY